MKNDLLKARELFQRTIARHNYGYILQEKRQVHLAVAVGKVVFYYRLPTRELNISLIEVNCSDQGLPAQRGVPITVCSNAYRLVGECHGVVCD